MKSFRMHDIVRELAVDLCHRECFGVVYEEDKYRESLDESDARRLVIHKLKKDIYQSVSGVHRLRSIIALDISIPLSTLLPLITEKCRYMSVLELSGLPIEKVPDAIGDLFNLRYLGLRGSKVKLLPKSIEKLSNLLTLDLSGSYVKDLPRGIGKLKKLRQLFADKASDRFRRDFQCGTGVRIPNGLENMTNLQTLLSLEMQDESVRQLGELMQLRSLEIWNVKGTYCEHICASLAEMRYMSYLHVNASNNNEVSVEWPTAKPEKAKFDWPISGRRVERFSSLPNCGEELVFIVYILVPDDRRPLTIPFSIVKFDGPNAHQSVQREEDDISR